jgi:hypothetical protein
MPPDPTGLFAPRTLVRTLQTKMLGQAARMLISSTALFARATEKLSLRTGSARLRGRGGRVLPLLIVRTAEFAGTSRFDVRRRIGEGGMGVVYEAYDRHRDMRVAIKTLPRLLPEALYRFKNEFRALADIEHPNLVHLHDLVGEGDEWFFTMELVAGMDFLSHVWGHGPRLRATPTDLTDVEATLPADAPPPVSSVVSTRREHASAAGSPAAITRLRAALRQLVAAVDAVHRAGKLHRDVKPANVLVESHGRVVLLDFGIALDLHDAGGRGTDADRILGTPAYMAPEQGSHLALTEAADWYSVGCILFEALTGRLPFEGTAIEMLIAKRQRSAPRARDFVPDVPPDLDALCAALLATTPRDRPSGVDLMKRIAPSLAPPASDSTGPVSLSAPRGLVGRDGMFATLRLALEAVRRGRPALVHVVGRSGIGKTALVRQFIAEVEAKGDAVVLAGRCYERESVPYKGFDAVIDRLSHYLETIPPRDCAALVPRDAKALARVFPVLDRVAAFAHAPRRSAEAVDPHQVRTRAFGALREILGRIADQRPVILFIDDLQWGDGDSAALLDEITGTPEPPVLLVILAYRSEDVAAQQWLASLARSARPSSAPPASAPANGPYACELALGALGAEDALTVAATLLDVPRGDRRASEIAAESGGSPFFIGELARYALTRPADAGAIRLEDVVASRLRALSPTALHLLETIAVAGHPIDCAVAFRGLELTPAEGAAAVATLRAAHLLRAHGLDPDRVEAYHDRIRETVLGTLDDDRRRGLHARLADALVALEESDPDTLFLHAEAGGQTDRAAGYAEAAASRAASLLAFDRAASLYQRALALVPEESPRRQRLRILLAESLARAGRGAAAADAYIASAEEETGAARLELHKCASEQLLFSGHIDRGMDLLRKVLAQERMRLAPTPLLALLGLVLLRLLIFLRGTRYRESLETKALPALIARVDTCNIVANGLSFVDNIQGRFFQARGVLAALQAGEPSRVVHALAGEAIFAGTDGWRSRARALALLEEADQIIERTGVRDKRGSVEYARGMVHHITGQWAPARECFARAETLLDGLAERSSRVERDGALSYGLTVLVLLGSLRDAAQRQAVLRREAEDRGDLFLSTNLCIGFANQVWLFADQPGGARSIAAEAMARWSPRGFHLQHWHELTALTFIDLYDDEPERAVQRLGAKWKALRRSMLMRIELTAMHAHYLRGAANLAVAARAPARSRPLIAAAERDAHVLAANGSTWAGGLGRLLVAGSAALRGDTERAGAGLRDAARMFDETNLALFAAVARLRLGGIVGGKEGASLVADADAWMLAEGVRRPERIAAMMAPGFR